MQGGQHKRNVELVSPARRFWSRVARPPADFADTADGPYLEAPVKVLKPARAPSWRASSRDLLVGATVTEVTDTIPGELFDELFKGAR